MSSMTGNRGPTGVQSGGGKTGDVMPRGYKTSQLQQYTPEQMELFSQMFSHVSPDSYTSRLASGDQSTFGEVEAPAMRQFQALQGQIGSRFSGMGMGGQKNSGFQNTMGQLGSDFAMQLQSQRQQMQRQAIQDLMGYSNQILGQRPYDRQMVEKAEPQKSGWGGAIGAGVGALGGFAIGGPAGAVGGGKLGYDVGSAF